MLCLTCNRELADRTYCEICDRQDAASGETADASEGEVEQTFDDDSNVPLAPEAPPQAADSAEDPPDLTPESAPADSQDSPPNETAPPGATTEASGSPSIDSEGEQSILEEAFKTIEDISETEIGEDSQTFRDAYTAGIEGGVRTGGDFHAGPRYYYGVRAAKPEDEVSLYALAKELPQHTIELPESAQAEVREKAARLKTTRLMFITCPYDRFALDAGYVAVEELGLEDPAQKRLLNYEDATGHKHTFTARNLLEQIPKEKKERVLLIYAQSESAQSVLESFFDIATRVDMVRAELQRNCLFLIVVAAPPDAQRGPALLRQSPLFAYAEVPFLRPFLQRHFPADCERLEAEIVEQRAGGKWEKDETRFCRQIVDFYESERLGEVVADGGPDDPRLSAESWLKGSNAVEKGVLYAAAFFQGVTMPEFCSVVEALLEGRAAPAVPPSNGSNGGDARAQPPAPLGHLWEEERDRIFNDWLRETSVAKESVRVVTLSDSALREPLQQLFEKKHRFYLIDQFDALQRRGILFHPSPRLGENAIRIAAYMAGAYPDKFNESWIVELVGRVRSHFEQQPSEGSDAMFQNLKGLQTGDAFNRAMTRLADVLRRLLGSPQLVATVQNSLEQLIKRGYHEEALLLLTQLQFAPDFDALYWFKQLLHRADNRTRNLTYYCLYAHLRRMGGDAYKGFQKVEAWLPKVEPQAERLPRARTQAGHFVVEAGREQTTYSQFDHFALRLLIQYCVETVARFNAKNYGEWPTRYLLLAVKDAAEAEERTSLVARWLLHPGIESTLVRLKMGGTRMTMIGALLAEWTFILLGPAEASAADGTTAGAETDAQDSPAGLFELLIRQFTSRLNLSQRLELLKYWNRLNHDLLKCQVRLPAASGLRSQLVWKRELVSRLIARVKRAPATGEALPAARGPQ